MQKGNDYDTWYCKPPIHIIKNNLKFIMEIQSEYTLNRIIYWSRGKRKKLLEFIGNFTHVLVQNEKLN